MRYWLMKSEPDTFSFESLLAAPRRVTSWEGVRNYQARNIMRDEMKLGDQVLFYHSSCEEPGAIGIAEVVREAHPDLTALDPKSPYFDAKSGRDGESRWAMVDVQARARFAAPVTLRVMREVKDLAGMMLLQRGTRLSVQPVTKKEWEIIVGLGKPQAV